MSLENLVVQEKMEVLKGRKKKKGRGKLKGHGSQRKEFPVVKAETK